MQTHDTNQIATPINATRQKSGGVMETVQRIQPLEEKDIVQGEFESAFGAEQTRVEVAPIQRRANNTGLPDNLKSGIENLSGYSMDDVKVHYNSDQPAQLNAHAYAQGSDIHVAPGQERHLPHEAWHVVQQKQGRVRPTMQLKDKVNINDDVGLEREADVMGRRSTGNYASATTLLTAPILRKGIVQRYKVIRYQMGMPWIEFDKEETLPDEQGHLAEDSEHIYKLPPKGTREQRIWVRLPLIADAKSQEPESKEPDQKDVEEVKSKPIIKKKQLKAEVKALKKELKLLYEKGLGIRKSQPKDSASSVYIKSILDAALKQAQALTKDSDKKLPREDWEKMVISLGHLYNTLQQQLSEIGVSEKVDKHLSGLNKDKMADHLHRREIKITGHETGLGIIPLMGGGLPNAAVDIVRTFYANNFDANKHKETGDEESILKSLADVEEKKIREAESQTKRENRRFGNGKDWQERQKLEEELRPKAASAAKRRTVTPKQGGSLRSWHLNDTGRLPRTVLKGQHRGKRGQEKGDIKKGFDSAAIKRKTDESTLTTAAQKGLHKLWEDEAKVGIGFQPGYIADFPNGADAFREQAPNIEPGYIEVNPEGWKEAESQGRLLYDYLDDRWFLTTDHYHDHFWEIMVSDSFKVTFGAEISSRKAPEQSKESDTKKESLDLSAYNNCLLDAVYRAAQIAGLNPNDPNVLQIRQRLQDRGLGNIGEMLYADQAVVEIILAGMGLMGNPVILYTANGQAQDVGGGGNGQQIIQIFHTGALHYVGEAYTEAQSSAVKKK